MNMIAIVMLLIAPALAKADEQYQMNNVIGNWFTPDGPFANDGIHIAKDSEGRVKLYYCERNKLRFEHVCVRQFSWEGTISYHQGKDLLSVREEQSPNPSYEMKIDEKDKNTLIRNWGSEKLLFFRQK